MDLSPVVISLKTAAAATVLTVILGVGAAWLVTGMKKGKFVADTVLSLPLVLPPTVVGFFLLMLLGKNTVTGRVLSDMGISLIFTWQGSALAAFVISFPIMYRIARAAFEGLDPDLLDAARTLGYGKAGVFFRVCIPLSWQSVAAGAVLSYARALGEFGASMMVAGNIPGKTATLPTAVYTAMQSGDRERAYQWVAVILVMSFVILICMNLWTGRQYTRK